jgi:subtilase family serine protease
MSPTCSTLLVEASSSKSNDLQTAMQNAVNLGANQISDSWSVTATGPVFAANFLKAAPGAALPLVFAAFGDAGADPLGTAEYPAAPPTVTAVGGTTLTDQ